MATFTKEERAEVISDFEETHEEEVRIANELAKLEKEKLGSDEYWDCYHKYCAALTTMLHHPFWEVANHDDPRVAEEYAKLENNVAHVEMILANKEQYVEIVKERLNLKNTVE